jgi:hypothetical protein
MMMIDQFQPGGAVNTATQRDLWRNAINIKRIFDQNPENLLLHEFDSQFHTLIPENYNECVSKRSHSQMDIPFN